MNHTENINTNLKAILKYFRLVGIERDETMNQDGQNVCKVGNLKEKIGRKCKKMPKKCNELIHIIHILLYFNSKSNF